MIEVFTNKDFRKWLEKNSDRENHVIVVLHKKHTGKNKTSAAELMKEAICFGWIDTTAKRIDENRWAINYRKRNKNSKWSYNTLRYGRELLKKGLMSPEGIKWYNEGKKKLPHDYGIPKNPKIPSEMKIILKKNNLLKEFNNLSSSIKRTYLRWIIRGKQEKTRKKRIESVVNNLLKKNHNMSVSLKTNI